MTQEINHRGADGFACVRQYSRKLFDRQTALSTSGFLKAGGDGGSTVRMHEAGLAPRPLPVAEDDTSPASATSSRVQHGDYCSLEHWKTTGWTTPEAHNLWETRLLITRGPANPRKISFWCLDNMLRAHAHHEHKLLRTFGHVFNPHTTYCPMLSEIPVPTKSTIICW